MNEERLITVRHPLIYGIYWSSYLPCAERELCQDRAPSSYSAQVAGYASVAIRCSNAGGHGQGLRGPFPTRCDPMASIDFPSVILVRF